MIIDRKIAWPRWVRLFYVSGVVDKRTEAVLIRVCAWRHIYSKGGS